MKYLRLSLLAGAALFAFGCSQDVPVGPGNPGQESVVRTPLRPARIVVMNQNMYVGADVDAVIRALASPDPTDDLPALLDAFTTLQETDFPTRAGALADEIARNRPHVVGLQEVSKIDLDLTPLGLPVVYHMDFLPVLLQALRERGLSYDIAAQVKNIEAAPLPGVSLIDYDAMLVDARRVTVGPGKIERNYSNNIGPVAPGVTLIRGWVSVAASIEGRRYRIASTHLESGNAPGLDLLRAAQIQELIASIAEAPRAIILGDLNDHLNTPMYQVAVGAGFHDVWLERLPLADGLTCCHRINLINERATFIERIDYVFARGFGPFNPSQADLIFRVGYRPGDKVPGPLHPLWASDHAGLVATLMAPLEQGECPELGAGC